MAKEEARLREELRQYKFKHNIFRKVPCSKEENAEYHQWIKNGGELPEGVYAENNSAYDGDTFAYEFYTIEESDLTESEIREYLAYKQLDYIRTIKNCVLFFTVSTIIGMIAYLIFGVMLAL